MSDGKHTPGPWRWIDGTLEQDVEGNNGDIILGLYDDGCTLCGNPADKPLIASAPDLLEALTRLMSEVDATLGPLIKQHNPELVADCRAALAKATP